MCKRINLLGTMIFLCSFMYVAIADAGDGSHIYWVSPTGSAIWLDCESETPLSDNACCQLSTANSNAFVGDVINLRGGTYNTQIKPSNSGSSGNPITYLAYNNETPIITNVGFNPGIYLTGRQYIKIDGITVSETWVLVEISGGSHFNELANCTLHGGANRGNSGVNIGDLGAIANTHNWIHDCVIYDAGYISSSCQDSSNLMKIGIYQYDFVSHHNTIENNLLYWGGHHVLETYTEYNVIRNNVFHNEGWMEPDSCTPVVDPDLNGKWGNRNIQIYDGNGRSALYNLIEGNRIGHAGPPPDGNGANNLVITSRGNIARYNSIYNAGEKNIYLKQGTGADSDNNRIYNNTCYVTTGQRPVSEGIFISDGSDNNAIKNNIFYNSYRYDIGLKIDGNIVTDNWITANGDPKFNNPDISDPSSTSLPDLSLQADSGAINGGTYLTQANGVGIDSTVLVVEDALYFQDGTWGSSLATLLPDWITIGTVDYIVQISSINYDTNTIILASPMTWSDNAPIWLYKDSSGNLVLYGDAPDIGAHEFQGPLPTCSELGGTCCSSGQICEGGTYQSNSDCGSLCCVGGTCQTPPPTCRNQGYQCCDSCEGEGHPEYDADCTGQVCCDTCITSDPQPDTPDNPSSKSEESDEEDNNIDIGGCFLNTITNYELRN